MIRSLPAFLMAWVAMTVAALVGPVRAEEEMLWAISDMPPFHITHQPGAGTGSGDRIIGYFVDRMPAYRHRIISVPPRRLRLELTNRPRLCAIVTADPGLVDGLSMSGPLIPLINHRFLFRATDREIYLPLAATGAEVSIERVATATDTIGAYLVGVAYSATLQVSLERLAKSGKARPISTSSALYQALDTGRVDWVVGHGMEAEYHFHFRKRQSPLESLSISGIPRTVMTQFACSAGAGGQEAARVIDQVITRNGPSPHYISFHRYWLDRSSRRIYNDVVASMWN